MAGHRPPKPLTLKSRRPSAKEVLIKSSQEDKASKKATTPFHNTNDLGMAGFRFAVAIATSSIFYLVTGGGINLGFIAITSVVAAVVSASIYVIRGLLREDPDPVEDWLEKNDDPLWLTNIKEMFMQDKIDVQRLERLTSLGWAGRLTDNGMRKRARLSIRTYGNELADRIAPMGRSNASDQYIGVQGQTQLKNARDQLNEWMKKPMSGGECRECSQKWERQFARRQHEMAATNENNYKPLVYISPKVEYHQPFPDPFKDIKIRGKKGLA